MMTAQGQGLIITRRLCDDVAQKDQKQETLAPTVSRDNDSPDH